MPNTELKIEFGGLSTDLTMAPQVIELYGGTEALITKIRNALESSLDMTRRFDPNFSPTSSWQEGQVAKFLRENPEALSYMAYQIWASNNHLGAVSEVKFNEEEGSLKNSIAKRFEIITKGEMKIGTRVLEKGLTIEYDMIGLTPDCKLLLKTAKNKEVRKPVDPSKYQVSKIKTRVAA